MEADELRRAAGSVVQSADSRAVAIEGAFVALSGPHPALLPLSTFPFAAVLLVSGSVWWSIAVVGVAWGGLLTAMRYSVVAWSVDEVFVLSAARWRARPVELVGRLPLAAALLAAEGSRRAVDPLLEPSIVIGGARYQLLGWHADEAGRLRTAWRAEVAAAAVASAR